MINIITLIHTFKSVELLFLYKSVMLVIRRDKSVIETVKHLYQNL